MSVFAFGGSFKDVCGELIGVGQNRPFRDLLYLLLSVETFSEVLHNARNENRGEKVKINNTFNAADDRRRAADKERGQSASSL